MFQGRMRMKGRRLWLLAAAMAATSLSGTGARGGEVNLPGEATATTPVHRIGIITYAGPGGGERIKQELARIGYREGENVVYREWAGNRDLGAMDGHARELVAWRPDLIVSLMTNAHVAVQRATARNPIPVIFWSADPLGTGVIRSYRKPGTNFTGFSYEPHVQLLQVRFLKQAVPGIRCIGHLYNHTYAPAPGTLRELQAAGALMNLPVKVYEVLESEGLEPAIRRIREDGCGGFVVGPHELFNANGARIGRAALDNGLAAVSIQISVARGGGLATFAPPFERGWAAMALVADRLLKGEAPGEIPIERGFKSPMTINLQAASALGLTLPDALIDEADEVIR